MNEIYLRLTESQAAGEFGEISGNARRVAEDLKGNGTTAQSVIIQPSFSERLFNLKPYALSN